MPSLRATLVLADLHLTSSTAASTGEDLARLLDAHPGARVIFAGDLFDLAIGSNEHGRGHAVRNTLQAQPAIRSAFGRHLERGGELWLLPGNHDPDLDEPELRAALLASIEPQVDARSRLRTLPWFMHDGALHVEHGHAYDPDNVPGHPLVRGAPSLGAHFCTQFMLPTGAHGYLLTNDATPGRLFLDAFGDYGWRGPYVVWRYFYAAFGALGRSGPFYRARDERERGRACETSLAGRMGLAPELVTALGAELAAPTLESLPQTFARVYLDRALGTATLVLGLGALGLGRRRLGALGVGLGAAVLGASWLAGHDRYQGSVIERLREAAARVRRATEAKLVVLGHTHQPELGPGYANPGSFAHPRQPAEAGRPFLEIVGDPVEPRAVLRRWPTAGWGSAGGA
jgi:UDP-2,3-diacylglucosamine pyrophosphatase LpxH